jgi:hypothetical protein
VVARYLVRSLKVSRNLTYVDDLGISHAVDRREIRRGVAIVNLECGEPGHWHDITRNPLRRGEPVSCMACVVASTRR